MSTMSLTSKIAENGVGELNIAYVAIDGYYFNKKNERIIYRQLFEYDRKAKLWGIPNKKIRDIVINFLHYKNIPF